jgi:hypothetical protein
VFRLFSFVGLRKVNVAIAPYGRRETVVSTQVFGSSMVWFRLTIQKSLRWVVHILE